jgi:L-malate glycosyltransferase
MLKSYFMMDLAVLYVNNLKVLWITNIIFPEPSKALGLPVPVGGGWMYGLAEQLKANKEITLAVATVYEGNDVKCIDLNGIIYYLLPCKITLKYPKKLELLWQEICSSFMPDLVHIHGTEYQHGLACMRVCNTPKYVVSMQGLVSVCARYYYAGLTITDILKNITVRDILRIDTLFHAKIKFTKRGVYEQEYIKKAQHVIGRTAWDHAHAKIINKSVAYHYCNETLRNGFYHAPKWEYNKKRDHTIFLSQTSYPLKGLHQVLNAIALLVSEFPDIKLRVAGHSIINNNTFVNRLKISGYGSYIIKLITTLNLEDRIVFTGLLSEEDMIKEYLNAHLFICPSSIENSPNSLAEAQMLGVPIIASYVGGIPDMIIHGETGLLYRFEEVEMLAENIRKVFYDDELSQQLSEKGITVAEYRHNIAVNCDRTISIYKSIIA